VSKKYTMTFSDILNKDIQRLRSAELDQLRTLPQLAESASDPDVQAAFREHLTQTEQQLRRLDTITASYPGPLQGCATMRWTSSPGIPTMKSSTSR
jgi:ferritin-like metal-binding protein YciE